MHTMGAFSSTRVVAEARQLARMELERTPFGSSGRVSLGRGSPGRVVRDQKVSAIKRHPRVQDIRCMAPGISYILHVGPACFLNL